MAYDTCHRRRTEGVAPDDISLGRSDLSGRVPRACGRGLPDGARVTQQGKYLVWALTALGLAVAVVVIERMWVTDNERIERWSTN